MHTRQLAIIATILLFAGSASSADSVHHFGAATFTQELWANSKAIFKAPIGVDVEFVTAGAFDWILADQNGAIVKVVRHKNENAGWTSINLPSLGLHGNYSIGFRNASAGEQRIKQGDVRLK